VVNTLLFACLPCTLFARSYRTRFDTVRLFGDITPDCLIVTDSFSNVRRCCLSFAHECSALCTCSRCTLYRLLVTKSASRQVRLSSSRDDNRLYSGSEVFLCANVVCCCTSCMVFECACVRSAVCLCVFACLCCLTCSFMLLFVTESQNSVGCVL
jgi:hypothetical protein